MRPEYEQLNQLRLEQDWTWNQLSAAIKKHAKVDVSARTLHHLLTYEKARARDRTLFKIQIFLEKPIARLRRRPKPRQASAAAEEATP